MNQITLKDMTSKLDQVLISNSFYNSRSDIKYIIDLIKEDLCIDFTFKIYKELIKDFPEVIFSQPELDENPLANSTSDNKKGELFKNNPEISIDLLKHNGLLNTFFKIYNKTKYFSTKAITLHNINPKTLYKELNKSLDESNNRDKILDKNPFNAFLLEELLQSSGIELLYNTAPLTFYESSLLCNKITVIRSMYEFYLPLTAKKISELIKNIKCTTCIATYYYIINYELPDIYNEFSEIILKEDNNIDADTIRSIARDFIVGFNSSLKKSLLPGELKRNLISNIESLSKPNEENQKFIDLDMLNKDLTNLFEREFDLEDKEVYNITSKTLKEEINSLENYINDTNFTNKYSPEKFSAIIKNIYSELTKKHIQVNNIIDKYIIPLIECAYPNNDEFSKDILPEFLEEFQFFSSEIKQIVTKKSVETKSILYDKSREFTYENKYKKLFSGLRRNLLSSYNALINIMEIIEKLAFELDFIIIAKAKQLHYLIYESNDKETFIFKYKDIIEKYTSFVDNSKDIYSHYIPYLYLNTSIKSTNSMYSSVVSAVYSAEKYYNDYVYNVMNPVENPLANFNSLYENNMEMFNIGDIVYKYSILIKRLNKVIKEQGKNKC